MTEQAAPAANPATKTVAEQIAEVNALGKQYVEEQKKSLDQRDASLVDKLDKKIDEKLAAVNATLKAITDRFPSFSMPGAQYDPDGTKKGKAFNFARAAIGIVTGDWSNAGYEKEVFDGMRHTKTMTYGVDTAGGFMVPMEIMGGIIEKLLPQVVAYKLGTRRVTGANASPIVMNRETGTTTAYWVGENLPSTLSDASLGQMELSPKQLIARTNLSNLLLNLSGGAAEQFIVNGFSRQFALGIDRGVMLGSGASNQPTGIVNTPGVNSTSLAGPTFNQLHSFPKELRSDDALIGNKLGWAMHPDKLYAIHTMLDATSQELARRLLDGPVVSSLIGYPYGTTTQLPSSGANAAIFGAWDTSFVIEWFGGMELTASKTGDTNMEYNTTTVRGVIYADVGIEQPTAFCTASA